jgi:hypothetical protein
MAGSSTFSDSSTYSDARASYVLDKIFDDLTGIVVCGLATQAMIEDWKSDLTYILGMRSLDFFEIQFTKPNTERAAFRYNVKDYNSVKSDSDSGNLDLYGLPHGTKARLFAKLKEDSPNYKATMDELNTNRGWGTNGSQTPGNIETHHSYSKDGYGVNRSKIGEF